MALKPDLGTTSLHLPRRKFWNLTLIYFLTYFFVSTRELWSKAIVLSSKTRIRNLLRLSRAKSTFSVGFVGVQVYPQETQRKNPLCFSLLQKTCLSHWTAECKHTLWVQTCSKQTQTKLGFFFIVHKYISSLERFQISKGHKIYPVKRWYSLLE